MSVLIAVIVGSVLCGVIQAMLGRPRDPDWLRELHARHTLQEKLDKGLSPEASEILNRIMWDKYK